MKKNLIPIIGILSGITIIIWSINMSGDVVNFINLPSVLITVLGSFCALMISFPLKTLMHIPKMLMLLLSSPEENRKELVTLFSGLARKARKDGLLALEDDIEIIEDKFLVSGMQMIVDGMEPDMIRKVMELKLDTIERRHKIGQEVFKKWAELAPAFGMIGTLIGLIIMLSKLDDPSTIGMGMATALVTTFYGSLLANLVLLPVANNLGLQTEEEMYTGQMIIEGVLEIQAGTNPRLLEEKLMTYLSSEEKLELSNSRGYADEVKNYE